VIKKYFLNYEETSSNDFVLSGGGRDIELMNRDISDWRITFADTGVNANIGQRLMAVRKYLSGEPTFLANYADGLTDMHLPIRNRAVQVARKDRQFRQHTTESELSRSVWFRRTAVYEKSSR